MADNYLESKMEELRQTGQKKPAAKHTRSLETLFTLNRSYRGYDKKVVVGRSTLEKIVTVNTKIPSAKNQQVLRFKLITRDSGADKVLQNIKLGGMLPELHLPCPGTEPEAFIIICSTVPESKLVDIDLGIAAQSMLLRAVDLGLNGLMIGAFNKAALKQEFALELEPLLILAIGKGAEEIRLTTIPEGESHAYYRENGVHFVPKVRVDDLILP
ncbi:MAG: nitroreductase family protein [Bacteroidales bacterium]|nr:nitroreductase family protein [Bacteroidales bacterium]